MSRPRPRHSSSALLATAAVVTVAATAVTMYRFYQKKKSKTTQPLKGILQCQCGAVEIQVNASSPLHIICYCDDCQNYETYCRQQRQKLKGDVKNQDEDFRRVADVHGGVRVCQVYKSDFAVIKGMHLLQPTVLDPTKIPKDRPFQVIRFHAKCCCSPMISACFRDIPVMGVFTANLLLNGGGDGDNDSSKNDQFCMATKISEHPETFDWDTETISGLPPVKWRINEKYAKHPEQLRPGGGQEFPALFLWGFIWRNFIVGPGRKTPCPFALPPKGQEVVRDL